MACIYNDRHQLAADTSMLEINAREKEKSEYLYNTKSSPRPSG